MIQSTDLRLLNLMIEKIERLIETVNKHSLKEIEGNYYIYDSIQFEFEKLFEDCSRLSAEFIINNPELPFKELRSIRNHIAHDYGSVVIKKLVLTAKNDLPVFKEQIQNILSK